ncbi:MAG: kelch repeat-containing protein, partial [Pseudomonadota bacterium]
EDGLVLDKLIFTKDQSYTPTGAGVATDNGSQTSTDDASNDVSDSPTNTDTDAQGNTDTDDDAPDATGGVVVEIEDFSVKTAGTNRQWIAGNKAGASGNASMVTSPDGGAISQKPAGSAQLSYQVNFPQAGRYLVWMRGWGDTATGEGKSDSVHVGLNAATAQVMENFPAGWHWSNSKRGGGQVTVQIQSAGNHQISVWMREDGLTLDKMIFTMDQVQAPANISSDNNGSSTSGTVSGNSIWQRVVTSDGSSVIERHEAGGVVIDGKLYVVGGRGTREVSVYDPASNQWDVKSAPPLVINHFQPVVFNNKIWIIGAFTGNYPSENPVADIYTYTPATDKWEKAGVVPQARRRGSAGAVVHNGLIYIVGGNTNGHLPGAKPWFDSYNPNTGEWKVLANAPTSRDHATVAVSGGKLVVAAGRNTQYPDTFANTVAATDVYDFTSQNWSTGKSVPTTRAGTMTVAVGSEVIVIGGETATPGDAKDDVEAYNVQTNQWRSLKPLSVGRHSGAAAVLGDKIHVVSGSERRGGAPESDVHETLKID